MILADTPVSSTSYNHRVTKLQYGKKETNIEIRNVNSKYRFQISLLSVFEQERGPILNINYLYYLLIITRSGMNDIKQTGT